MLSQSPQHSYVVPPLQTPRAAPQVGPSAERQVGNAGSNISNQLETLAGSAIATGVLTVAAACVSSSRNVRGGRLRSIPCSSQSSDRLSAESEIKAPVHDNSLSQLVSLAAEVVL